MSDDRTQTILKLFSCPIVELHWILNFSNVRQSIHPWFLQSNVEESFGSVSRWLKSSCPPAARWRERLRGDEIFAILFRNAKWKGFPNSLRNWDVDLHFQHGNWLVNSSLDFTNVINLRRCCVNLQAIWHIISIWPNNRSRGLKLLSIWPKFRRLLAVPVRMYVSSYAETLLR
jgi:hypothetical protein